MNSTPESDSRLVCPDLRAELDRIAAAEGKFLSDGTLNNWEVQSLLEELSGFSRRLDAYLTNPTMTSAATVNMASERGLYDACKRGGQSEDAVSSQEQLQATVDTRWARLDSSLEVGINAGYIDWAQALRLEAELEKISEDEYHFLQDGRLSYREANQIIADLDALETQITTLQSAFNRSRRARFGNRSQSPALLAR